MSFSKAKGEFNTVHSKMPSLTDTAEKVKDLVQENLSEDFIIIESDSDRNINSVVQRIMGDITAASAGRQAAIGGVTGW